VAFVAPLIINSKMPHNTIKEEEIAVRSLVLKELFVTLEVVW